MAALQNSEGCADMKIYMPVRFPEPLMTGWSQDVILDVDESGYTSSRETMKSHLADADVVVINLDDVFDREMIDASPKLKVITLFAGSTYNIDVAYAKSKGIVICTTPGEIFENTADLTFALLLAVARRIPEADAYVRAGLYHSWQPAGLLGGDIYHKTIGIVGLGTIGACVARRAKGFGMRILYTAAHGPKPELEKELGCTYVDLDTLLNESDFVTLHCKLTPETHGLIGAREIDLMKSTAYLINTGRGALVDEKTLADRLEQGRIAGAGLDVFAEEPNITEKLLTLENVVLTPHLGASSRENRIRMAEIAADCTRAALAGNEPQFHA